MDIFTDLLILRRHQDYVFVDVKSDVGWSVAVNGAGVSVMLNDELVDHLVELLIRMRFEDLLR